MSPFCFFPLGKKRGKVKFINRVFPSITQSVMDINKYLRDLKGRYGEALERYTAQVKHMNDRERRLMADYLSSVPSSELDLRVLRLAEREGILEEYGVEIEYERVKRGLDALPYTEEVVDTLREELGKWGERERDFGVKTSPLRPLTEPDVERHWKGEHYENGQWVYKEGYRWDPRQNTWVVGVPLLDYFHWYCEFILPEFRDAKPLGSLHQKWSDELESDDKLLMIKPRDHYKTSFISIGYALYNLCERLLYPIMIVSLADSNTRRTFGAIRYHLSKNERILSFYGELIDPDRPNNTQELFTKYHGTADKDATLFCGTFGSNKIMGTHPRLAILDDIQQEPLSPALMRQAIQLIDANLIPAVGKRGKLIILGTIKGYGPENDIYLYCEAKGDVFSVYKDPAVYLVDPVTGEPRRDSEGNILYGMPPVEDVTIRKEQVPLLDDNGEIIYKPNGQPKMTRRYVVEIKHKERYRPIYPEGYSLEDICIKRAELTDPRTGDDAKFWSEYFLRPVNPSGNFFNKDRITFSPPSPFSSWESFIASYLSEKNYCYLWVDPGGKKSHGTAIVVMGLYNGGYVVFDMVIHRGGIHDIGYTVAELIIRWNVRVWGVEANFAQATTFGEIIDETVRDYLRSHGYGALYSPDRGVPNRGDKILRIQTNITAMLGRDGSPVCFFVNPNINDHVALDRFKEEFTTFPELMKGAGHEFDILDAIGSIFQHLMGNEPSLLFVLGEYASPFEYLID